MSPNLSTALTFLAELARYRLAPLFGKDAPAPDTPALADDEAAFTRFALDRNLTVDEFTVLATGLVAHLQPTFFDDLVGEYITENHDFKPIGGVKGANSRCFLPTGETVLFLLAGADLARRLQVQQLFDAEHFFAKEKILYLEELRAGEPPMSGRLVLDPEYAELFTTGKRSRPRFGLNFPAERIETSLGWDDLVLPAETQAQVQELLVWLRHGTQLMQDESLGKRLKPGYRALFWGPPGTGKTFTAGLLGKHSGRDVYKIDLSMVVSKYIGETEKNLATLFDKAENKDWILFFDEADALFGKRTSIRDAHDKYANQEVSYLLQRVEHYNGLVILASNFKSNIDEAFVRRFQSIIHFPMPKASERLLLWQKSLPAGLQINGLNLPGLAQKYELTGAAILNVVQYACLQALERGNSQLQDADLRDGILREFKKEGKIVN